MMVMMILMMMSRNITVLIIPTGSHVGPASAENKDVNYLESLDGQQTRSI